MVVLLPLLLSAGCAVALSSGAWPPEGEGFPSWYRNAPEELPSTPATVWPASGLPAWLRGRLVRFGGGQTETPGRNATALFDGMAKMHAWTLSNTTAASFSSRFINSTLRQASLEAGKFARFRSFAPFSPAWGLFEKAMPVPLNTNINAFVLHDDPFNTSSSSSRMVVMSETPQSVDVDPWTLQTIGQTPVAGMDVSNGTLTCAHPQRSPDGRWLYNFMYEVTATASVRLRFFKVDLNATAASPAAPLTRIAIGALAMPYMSYMHSWSMTQSYAVLTVWPAYFNLLCMLIGSPVQSCLTWAPTKGVYALVFDLAATDPMAPPVAQIDLGLDATSILYSWHHVNAFEVAQPAAAGGGATPPTLIVDMLAGVTPYDVAGPDSFVILANGLNASALSTFPEYPKVWRLTLDLALLEAQVQQLPARDAAGFDYQMDTPRIDEGRRSGRSYCYFWGWAAYAQGSPYWSSHALVKVDVCAAARAASSGGAGAAAVTATAWHELAHYTSEPVFIPRPGGTAEDDGVILSEVLDGTRDVTVLVVLDAQTMTEIARIDAGASFPQTFHGVWVPMRD